MRITKNLVGKNVVFHGFDDVDYNAVVTKVTMVHTLGGRQTITTIEYDVRGNTIVGRITDNDRLSPA